MIELIVAAFNSLGLKVKERLLIFKSLGVLVVLFHILWVCGWLTFMGLQAPFASAADLKTALAQFAQMQEASNVSARINIANEIRQQIYICQDEKKQSARLAIAAAVEQMQEEYKKFSGGQRYDAGKCP